MKYTNHTMQPAIAMIELIFAIVVMGIVMMSVPQLLTTASKSGYVAIQQEAINEASTQMNIILGYKWDENNTGTHVTILNTTNGDSNLSSKILFPTRRQGTPSNSLRVFSSNEYNASQIGLDFSDAGKIDDMDDFNGIPGSLHLEAASVNSDYIDTVSLLNTVSYISDTVSNGTYIDPQFDHNLTFNLNTTAKPAGQTTNIKHIQVTLTSTSGVSELNKTIILHAFSCNIGRYKLEEKN